MFSLTAIFMKAKLTGYGFDIQYFIKFKIRIKIMTEVLNNTLLRFLYSFDVLSVFFPL